MSPDSETLGTQPTSAPTGMSSSSPTMARRAVLGSVVTSAILFALGVSACTGSSSPPAEFLNRSILYELESRGSSVVVLRGESVEDVWPVTVATFVDFLVKRLSYKVSWEQIETSKWILRTSFVDRMTKDTIKIDMMLELAKHKIACGEGRTDRMCEGVVVLVSDFVFNGERPSHKEAWDFIIDVRNQAHKSM